ncbi:MAG: hypothetical protein NTV86_13525 [Planctomycetota bacterium]|nr:hypothetical protein [Planctomycetota bacterium]
MSPYCAPQYKFAPGACPLPSAAGTGWMLWLALSHKATNTCTTLYVRARRAVSCGSRAACPVGLAVPPVRRGARSHPAAASTVTHAAAAPAHVQTLFAFMGSFPVSYRIIPVRPTTP